MPHVFDLVVMLSCTLEPERAPVHAIAVTLGSSLGTLVVFGLARAGRTKIGKRIGATTWIQWAERMIQRYGVVAVTVGAILPAPFPFKYAVIAAGYLRHQLLQFTLAVLLGRGIRFGAQALVAVYYGQAIIEVFQRYAIAAAIGMGVLLLLLAAAYRTLQQRTERT